MERQSQWELIPQVPQEIRNTFIKFIMAVEDPSSWIMQSAKVVENTALNIIRHLELSHVPAEILVELKGHIETAKREILKRFEL